MSWEIHNDTLSPDVFNLVNDFIKEEYGDGYFNGTWMLITFWEDLVTSETSSNVSFLQAQPVIKFSQMHAFLY